jgi:DNA-binding NarL/FixJ family response regulator
VNSAINLILDERPDVLLLDLNMPNMPTVDFINKINEIRHDEGVVMKLLLYSAHTSGELHEFAQRYGADGYVEKSQGISECVAAVSAHFERSL